MTLSIFSFQRAFTAKQQMALAAGNCTTPLAAIDTKDILDCLHLGIDCGITGNNEFCNSTATVDEFIANCESMLKALSNTNENNVVTISLSHNHPVCLKEKNGDIIIKMHGERVILPNLTLQDLYKNLIQDIQNNPQLYGNYLINYTNCLEQSKKLLPPATKNPAGQSTNNIEVTYKALNSQAKNFYTISNSKLGGHFIMWFKEMHHKGETVRALNIKSAAQPLTIRMHIQGTESHPIYTISFHDLNETDAIARCEVNKLSILENHTLEQYIS